MNSPPFYAVELYYVHDAPEYRAYFDDNARGNILIRILGDNEAWVWSALFKSLSILYFISVTVKVSEHETLILAGEF